MLLRLSMFAAILFFLGSNLIQKSNFSNSIEGAWNIVEVQFVKADGKVTSVKPLESLVLLTKDHYSFCWSSHKSISNTWQISDSERVSRFNQSLINSGTYKFSDSLLVTRAEFALVPKFVNGTASFRYNFSGDTLILTV